MLFLYAISVPKEINEKEFEYLKAFVSKERKEKIDRFHGRLDKIRSLLAEILLRFVLQKELNYEQDKIEFEYNQYGKPSLKNVDNLNFNLSHSGSWVICGVSDSKIGLDVETVDDKNLDLAKRFFTEEEYNEIIGHPIEKQSKQFFRYWTLKESFIKAEGKGLSIPLNSFSFQVQKDNIQLFVEGKYKEDYNFYVNDLDELHAMAICWGGGREKLHQTILQTVTLEEILDWKFTMA